MKKVLIISYFWPYCAGSKRVFGLAKYLPLFGWQPVILTGPLNERPDPSFRVIETGYKGFLGSLVNVAGIDERMDVGDEIQRRLKKSPLRRSVILRFFYNLVKEFLAYPDEHKHWASFALREGETYIEREGVDAILSIWPITGHCVARTLQRRYTIPWIADFPDLWSENAAYPYSGIRRYFDRMLEKKTVRGASALTTSSPVYRERLSDMHADKKVFSVLLGFDPEILHARPASLSKKFSILYTGMFYAEKRMPTKFFQSMAELIKEKKIDTNVLEVTLYGPRNDQVVKEIEQYGLSDVVSCHDSVPYAQCLLKQREAQVLLQINWDDPEDKGVFSGKMFDYLASLRPILAVGGHGGDVVEAWLKDTNAGIYRRDVPAIKEAILSLYEEYRRTGSVLYRGDRLAVERYSQKNAAEEFAKILNDATVTAGA